MSSATTTTDGDVIRSWAGARRASAVVADTADNNRSGAILRIDFEGPGVLDEGLRRIEWNGFFEIFDANDLAFVRQEEGESRFTKFVSGRNAGN